jgi:hypothetical protein
VGPDATPRHGVAPRVNIAEPRPLRVVRPIRPAREFVPFHAPRSRHGTASNPLTSGSIANSASRTSRSALTFALVRREVGMSPWIDIDSPG